MSKKLTRRDLLKLSGGLAASSLLAACAPAPTPQVIKETVPAVKETVVVKETVPAAKETVVVKETVQVTQYACPWCTKVFGTLAALKDHTYTQHAWNANAKLRSPIPVAITISSINEKAQLEKRVNECAKRGFEVSIRTEPSVVGGTYLRQLADAGYEINLSFSGLENYPTYEAGLKFISDAKKGIEDVIGKPLLGGGASRFAYQRYTFDILDALGFKWYRTSYAYETLPGLATWPYRMPGHNFVRIPVQAICGWNPGGDVLPAPTTKAGGGF